MIAIGGVAVWMGVATALTAHNDRTIWEFDFDREIPICRVIMPSPLICIPTTAGTGAETESTAMVTHAERGMNFACGTPD